MMMNDNDLINVNAKKPHADPTIEIQVQVQIEDYGECFALPHFEHLCPSVNYFESNLMMQIFIIADLTKGVNNVILYDKCGQGKDTDALCSLRSS